MGAEYTSEAANDVLDLSLGAGQVFVAALRHCVKRHPILSSVITGSSTETPGFATPKKLDLSKHLEIRDNVEDLSEAHILAEVSDQQFSAADKIPPWKVVLTPLTSSSGAAVRLLVLFAYYHSHGDGKSGLAFHRTFLDGLNEAYQMVSRTSREVDYESEPSMAPLPPPIEEAGNLSLSWSYLLSPLLGEYLPSFIATRLRFRASSVAQDDSTMRGTDLTFDPDSFRTGLETLTINHETLRKVLQHCKARKTTFTGLLNQVIARSLSTSLETEPVKAFASQIVIDLRHILPDSYTDNTMANCVSAYNETIPRHFPGHHRDWTKPSAQIWTAARQTSAGLVKSASTLHNQPIGLLAYLREFRPWTLGQIGKRREVSYEISNLTVFDPVPREQPSQPSKSTIQIEKTIFSQPANASGACLNFNLVTTKGGPLVMTVTWQLGVLSLDQEWDLGPEMKEAGHVKFQEGYHVREVCSRIENYFDELAAAPLED